MLRFLRIAVAAIPVLAAAASSAAADRDPRAQTRVTIRGTGSSVTIERTQTPARHRSDEAGLPAGVLGEAIRMKREGADDSTLIAYLRKHGADLPPVIESRDVSLLRKAGAGKSVTNFLATVSAVELGPMGEGHEAVDSGGLPAPEIGMPAYGTPEGYGGFGYAATYPVYPLRHAPRPFPHIRHGNFRPPLPRFRSTFPARFPVTGAWMPQ